jgi:hypothetical protein
MLISSRGRLGRRPGGLGDPLVEGPELFPGELRPVTFTTPLSTMTVGPLTVRAAAPAKKKAAPIWGLPPMVAYAIMAVTITGAGLWVYQRMQGGRAPNPRRRRNPRAKRPRYKR